MSKREKIKWKELFGGRVKDILLIGILALVLFYTAWQIFQKGDSKQTTAELAMSETEVKILRILQEIEGVGEASVVVCEGEEEVKSVVVVCEGAKDLRVVMNVREAVSTALAVEQKSVKIYLKKE